MQLAYVKVASNLQRATNQRALDDAAEQIQHVGGINEQNRLGTIYKRRMDEFKAAQQ